MSASTSSCGGVACSCSSLLFSTGASAGTETATASSPLSISRDGGKENEKRSYPARPLRGDARRLVWKPVKEAQVRPIPPAHPRMGFPGPQCRPVICFPLSHTCIDPVGPISQSPTRSLVRYTYKESCLNSRSGSRWPGLSCVWGSSERGMQPVPSLSFLIPHWED